MNEADRVFDMMLQRNIKPNEAIYNILVHGHCRGGNLNKAIDLYGEMVHHGLIPHAVTVIVLIKEVHKIDMERPAYLSSGPPLWHTFSTLYSNRSQSPSRQGRLLGRKLKRQGSHCNGILWPYQSGLTLSLGSLFQRIRRRLITHAHADAGAGPGQDWY
ncbi:unnamed protein product [Fraxinus pennsylvanica]|uniref:Pentatricopeptide repeat-containing protein n=1 Tax=Fraxinus pennsylvanica TaxID=56036 RepID=A0AAD1ZA01_9LAMI|nr:unnamed protein product [Fraxinus pennsylvanica]